MNILIERYIFLKRTRFHNCNMTICVAAIGEYEKLNKDCDEIIVFATDHMITLQQVGQFEHAIEKYRRINPNTIAMLSGEALLFQDILKGIDKKDDFNTIKNKIHDNMIKIREERLKKRLLAKFKINFDYLKELLKLPKHNDEVVDMLEAIRQFGLQTSVILVGFINGKAQIAEINEMATVNTRDINFDAIGTGGTQAINTLLFQRHSKKDSLKTTLYNVYKAKRNSEVAQGVGKETDLFILTATGKICKIKKEDLNMLDSVYLNELKFGKEHKEVEKISIKSLGEK